MVLPEARVRPETAGLLARAWFGEGRAARRPRVAIFGRPENRVWREGRGWNGACLVRGTSGGERERAIEPRQVAPAARAIAGGGRRMKQL